MARGTQLGQLVTQFRNEARQSPNVSHGAATEDHVKQLLARTQRLLYEKHFWSFLSVLPTKAIVAGSRYYDPPADLNFDRLIEVVVLNNSMPERVERGIGFEEYAIYDPATDQRSSPVQKWDLRWTGSATQIEVWPLPAEASTLMFKCMRPLRALAASDDVADLDDDLIVLFAAAEELAAQKAKDAEIKLKLAQSHLLSLQANAQSGESSANMVPRPRRLGLGRTNVLVG